MAINIAQTGFGRVFIQLNPCTIGSKPVFEPCFAVQGIEESLGDISSVYCPDVNELNAFTEVISIKGASSRPTASLVTNLGVSENSTMYNALKGGCEFDIHVHYGRCIRPDDFMAFEKSILIQGARLTNYSLSSMVALTPDERGVITESSSISMRTVHSLYPVLLSAKVCLPPSVSSINEIILTPDKECDTGCNICNCGQILTTNANVLTTYISGNYIVSVEVNGTITIADEDQFVNNGVLSIFSQFSIPLNLGETISSGAFDIIGTTDGRLLKISDLSTVVQLNSPTVNPITAASFNNDVYTFGTSIGELMYAKGDDLIIVLPSPTGDSISSALAISNTSFIIGTSTGFVYYTNDTGVNWTQIQSINTGQPIISLASCFCANIYFASGNTLYSSYDYGSSFNTTIINDLTSIQTVVCCIDDPNLVAVGGLTPLGEVAVLHSHL